MGAVPIFPFYETIKGESRTEEHPALKLTDAERAAGVTPVNYAYPPGDVRRYGATGDGSTDDYAALERAHRANDQHSVYYPNGTYLISQSLTLYNQNVIGQCKEFVTIKPIPTSPATVANFPAFQNDTAQTISGRFQNFTIIFNSGVKPANDAAHNAQFGVYFRAPLGTSYYNIKDVEVRGALWAFNDDTSGSYGASLENVFARECQFGFRKIAGTTFHFQKCITLNANLHFFMQDTLGCSLTSCAGDGATITAGNAGIDFRSCMGFTIQGWDSESNSWSGNNSSLFSFLNSTGSVDGVVGYLNSQSATSPDFNSFIHVDGGQIHISGLRMKFDSSSLAFSGTGTPYGVLAENGAQVFISGSNIDPASGGAPAARIGLGATGTARIYYSGTSVSGSASNAYNLLIESGSSTLTETGCTTSPTGLMQWSRSSGQVTVYLPDINGTSTGGNTTCTYTGWPADIYPARTQTVFVRTTDNGTRAIGLFQVTSAGVVTVFPTVAAGGWAGAGSKGIESCTAQISLD